MNVLARCFFSASTALVVLAGCQADDRNNNDDVAGESQALTKRVQRDCSELQIPVDVPGVPGARIFARHCKRANAPAPRTVHFLVHGSTHNNTYADWPEDPE